MNRRYYKQNKRYNFSQRKYTKKDINNKNMVKKDGMRIAKYIVLFTLMITFLLMLSSCKVKVVEENNIKTYELIKK